MPGRRNRSAESKEHVLYYDIKQEQWTEDKEEVVGQPLTTSTRVRRYWDEEEPAPREASEVTHMPRRPSLPCLPPCISPMPSPLLRLPFDQTCKFATLRWRTPP